MPRKPPPASTESERASKPKRSRKSPVAASPPPEGAPQPNDSEPVNSLGAPNPGNQQSPEEAAMVEEFRTRYPFPLDPFQEEAIAHLATGESAMVVAPTGTGKSVVAEFGVFRAARKGFKVMY